MVAETRPPRRPCQSATARAAGLVAVAGVCLATLLVSRPTHAVSSDEPYRYQGSFWGLQAHTGLVFRASQRPGETAGPVLGGSFRFASVMSILDVQASIFASRYDTSTLDGEGVEVGRWSLGFEGKFHPLLIGHLYNNRFWYTLASMYVSFGSDLDFTKLDPRTGPSVKDNGLGWTLGAGIDAPLTDPNRGWGLWLGVAFRNKWLNVNSAELGLGDFDERMFMLTLAYRNNNIFFVRIPPPEELRHRDPPLPDL